MTIPTEPIGSVPRPAALQAALAARARGEVDAAEVERLTDAAVRDTLARFEATGSPIVTDGEQGKSSFVTYPLEGVTSLAPDGITIPFADGHTRRLPRLTAGPFRFGRYAGAYTMRARALTARPLKQAVISASALSLLYPADGIAGYAREAFLDDLVSEAEADIRGAFAAGAEVVQVDFTEGRLAAKLDPSLTLLRSFVALNNRVLDRFDVGERARIGVHTCPGGDRDSTHSADVDYAHLLPSLFELRVGRYYVQLASERDRPRVLHLLREHLRPGVRVFVGVTDPIDARVESPAEVRDRVLEAASILPIDQLGTTDDCGFAPFADDTSTARDTAFAKIRARVEGTALASEALGA
jgi:5-methyltetrahydropteroyltriglutamate--homocysteine methyltransferase